MIEKQHLLILREIERQGSLTAAADALCLTQSALSHAIKKLESQLQALVWVKEGRGLRLTAVGQYLLGLSQRLLPQFEHAEAVLTQMARGERGTLRIGIECHPCYRWLQKIVTPYLTQWPNVDVDVRQQFQFGGIAALFAYEIDMVVTPDPFYKTGLSFTPVFDYELVLVVAVDHPLAAFSRVRAGQLGEETLITYPVEVERLDIFSQFLLPAGCRPARHKTLENTDIMLQMVAAGRGVTALPRWLVDEYSDRWPLHSLALGDRGIAKQIFLGVREGDRGIDYLGSFLHMAQSPA